MLRISANWVQARLPIRREALPVAEDSWPGSSCLRVANAEMPGTQSFTFSAKDTRRFPTVVTR